MAENNMASIAGSGLGLAERLSRIGAVRYIKLGAGGAWEEAALSGGTLEWGAYMDPAGLLAAGAWDEVPAHYAAQGLGKGTATSFTREAREFHTLGADTLWITFARGQLWWAFAEPGVVHRDGGVQPTHATHYRRTIGSWCNTDVTGRPLAMVDISTRLTMLSAYRQTICTVGAEDYLMRVLRAEEDPALAAAKRAHVALEAAVLPLIQGLHQSEFELFTDLLFTRMGWRRVSVLGGTMKDIDLLVELPATGERAAVQVKSAAGQSVLDGCTSAFRASRQANRFFFVTHSAKGALAIKQDGADERAIDLLDGPALAGMTVRHGLTDWLMQRAA
jgi:hypothetical protein